MASELTKIANQLLRFQELLDEFEAECRERAFRGSKDPEDWDEIEARYKRVRDRITQWVNRRLCKTK